MTVEGFFCFRFGGSEMYKVMLVDDMDIVRLELKRLPVWGENTGFTIAEEARNGEEALKKLSKRHIDLVITDIKMPKVDGLELLKSIVFNNLCPCVVLLSDFSEFSYARQGIVHGAFDFLTKPADVNELSALLRRAYEYINTKKRESERVKKLEEVFDQKTEAYFQGDDIHKLIQHIQSRNSEAEAVIRHILDRIAANLDYEVMKFEVAVNKAIPVVLEGLCIENPWLEKFLYKPDQTDISDKKFGCYEEIIEFVMVKVKELRRILNLFQLGFTEKGTVWTVCNYVLDNIDNSVSLQMVAENLFINRTYLSEVFKQKTGISFLDYLTIVKMERAKILLRASDIKPYEVAEMLGYKDSEYFAKIFRKYIGKTITEYRRI